MPTLGEAVLHLVNDVSKPGMVGPEKIRSILEKLIPLVSTTEGAFAFVNGPLDNAERSGLRWLSSILVRHAAIEEDGGSTQVDYEVLLEILEVRHCDGSKNGCNACVVNAGRTKS